MLVALLAACGGGEGKCDFPPCEIPPHRCTQDADCFQTGFCDFQNDSCGASPLDQGFCNTRPQRDLCELESIDLVCGCDGVYHDNECAARLAGTDVAASGDCPVPPDAFSCGSGACVRGEQLCIELPRDAVNSEFRCELFPMECRQNPSCACFTRFGCEDCTEENGAFRMSCVFPDPTNEGR